VYRLLNPMGLYLLSSGHYVRRPAPKGQESLAQGLPWVSRNKRFALKGLDLEMRTLSVGSGFSPYRTAPSGLIPVGDQTQGEPWAKLSWPLRATDRRGPNCRALRDEESSQTALNFVPFNPGLCFPGRFGPQIGHVQINLEGLRAV
jgi:hypothetical protein